MPRDASEIHDDEFDALKDAIWNARNDGPFTTAEILFPALRAGIKVQADEIEPMLEYLVEMGHLFRVDDDPPRWKLAWAPADGPPLSS